MQEGDANRPGSGNPDVGGYETPSTYQSRGQQYLKIYTDNQVPADRWRLTHRLLRRETEFMRVYVSSGVMSGSMDVLLEQIDRRFGREIDENGVALIDCGEH
jgi:hypothetical protein